jgi:hypothetical protein
LHDIKRTLRGKGVVVPTDTIDDFALFGLRVWGDGKSWTCGGVSGLRGWCTRGSGGDGFRIGGIDRDGRWIHECDGGGTELCLGRNDFDAVAEDGGGGHVEVVWKCWWRWDLRDRMETLRFFRPLLSCSVDADGFFR